jgi:DNA-binding CsgD family transcriptional regulator
MDFEPADFNEFSDIIQSLYGALIAKDPWHDFLLRLRDYLNAKHAALILTPPNSPVLGTLINPTAPTEEMQRYLERYLSIDPFTNLPDGKIVDLLEYVPEESLKQTTYYKEWLKHADGSHFLGVDIRSSVGFVARLRIVRAPGGAPFTADERALLERIIPHFRQVIEIFQRDEIQRCEQAMMAGAVEQFSVGAIILDHTNQIVRQNDLATAILEEGDGISIAGKRISFANPTYETRLRDLMREVEGPNKCAASFCVKRASGRRDLHVTISRVKTPSFMQTGSTPAVALFLSDPERQCMVTGSAVRELLPLTPTEAEISASLANGFSVCETATRLGVAETTVRTHLRSIFAKTGVTRQPQLVHLIHTSLPEMSAARM